ncbi:hypothetical protein LINPERPRIM_LOCUS6782, partial [Linum perenne]
HELRILRHLGDCLPKRHRELHFVKKLKKPFKILLYGIRLQTRRVRRLRLVRRHNRCGRRERSSTHHSLLRTNLIGSLRGLL